MSHTEPVYVIPENGIIRRKSTENKSNQPATFETAIQNTGFGKFNVFLILVTLPAHFASIFETTTMSYIFASAQCDLDLSLEDKGYLNAITYAGMITSAVIWGFLFDTLGRKRLLICGFLLDAMFVILSSFSQSVRTLMICKFFGGFIINGPFAAMCTYLSEFHAAKYRPKIQMFIGTANSLATISLPLLAWIILPRQWNFSILGDNLKFRSWNFYLLACSLPSLYSGIVFIFLPESPKFLMTTGQNEKAIATFQRVYSINSGLLPETFPVKVLEDETKAKDDNKHGGIVTANRTKIQALKEGWQQITPLFYPPYLTKLIMVCCIQICIIQSINMLRLWMPQIFQAIDDYKHYHNGSTASLCTMLEGLVPKEVENECSVNMDNASVYKSSIIVSAVPMCGYIFAGSVVNYFGKKKIMVFFSVVAGITVFTLNLAQDSVTTIAVSSIFITLASVAVNLLLSVIVDIFPTTLRTLTVSITLMLARIGAIIGTILFPILLQIGCQPPFFYVGGLTIVSALLSLLLPNTDNKALR